MKYLQKKNGEGVGVDLPLQGEMFRRSPPPALPIHHVIHDYPLLSLKAASADNVGEGYVLPLPCQMLPAEERKILRTEESAAPW